MDNKLHPSLTLISDQLIIPCQADYCQNQDKQRHFSFPPLQLLSSSVSPIKQSEKE